MARSTTTFKKGTGGRKAGTPNKTTKNLRQFIHDFLNVNRERLQSDFESLDPKDRVLMFEKFLSFALPKLNNIGIENLPDEQLNEIIEQLKKSNESK